MIRPENLSHALEILEREPQRWKPFAGGTDLMVLLDAGGLDHTHFLSIWRLPELRFLEEDRDTVRIGALTTFTDIRESPIIQKHFPLLCEASRQTASKSIQNRGTIGGNIANGSPAADTPPVLLVYDAEIELISVKGTRIIPYSDFHRGYRKFALKPSELILAIRLSKGISRDFEYFRKVGARKAQAISKLLLTARAKFKNGIISEIRIAVGSVAEKPLRCEKTEALLEGKHLGPALISKARDQLVREISPIDDIRSEKIYREKVSQNLLEEFLRECLKKHPLRKIESHVELD